MQSYINTYQCYNNKLNFFKLFAYSSRGIPGLEINGLGSQGKLIREKIIYISKIKKLKIPNRKFMICLDQENISSLISTDIYLFELPISILFFSLSGIIKMHNFNNLFASGYFDTNGEIFVKLYEGLKSDLREEQILLIDKKSPFMKERTININDIWNN